MRVDRWDDWGKYRTQFMLFVFDEDGAPHDIGYVKIGHVGLKPGREVSENTRAPKLAQSFDSLPLHYFSLGQSEDYYENLNALSEAMKMKVLIGLRDIAYDLDLLKEVLSEDVMSESLLRYLRISNVETRLHSLALGTASLTPFNFEYTYPSNRSSEDLPHSLSFNVVPHSIPPTNVHVIIGRNGVGKTSVMQSMSTILLNGSANEEEYGKIIFNGDDIEDTVFVGLILVSFSAFDNFDLPIPSTQRLRVGAIGLRTKTPNGEVKIKDPSKLAEDFVNSFRKCKSGVKAGRWRSAVETLSNDPLFAETNIVELLELRGDDWEEKCYSFYDKLSSGHKIVLLTITRLVELVDEKTLVLIDEPEGHLHPPLLAAFVRTLSNLLIERNGVAIISTHSPVVLQEVPKSCVWVLHRSGSISTANRPRIETFGEEVGVLTREVFGLEVTNSGYHELIKKEVDNGRDYGQLINSFKEQIGAEGKAIAKAMILTRDS